jgi:hypothetical protein
MELSPALPLWSTSLPGLRGCAASQRSGLDVGIHLNLQGKPFCCRPPFTPLWMLTETFVASQIAKKLTYGQLPKEIAAEFRAQIDLMLSMGLKPSHADSHHRFHLSCRGHCVRSRRPVARNLPRTCCRKEVLALEGKFHERPRRFLPSSRRRLFL